MSTPDQIFLAAASFISYTYAAYPLGIWALSRTKPNECAPPLRDDACPEVTVVISAHNEAARVRRRIENLRSLDYPQDKLHLLFVSDGSSDRTAESLRQFPGVQVIEHAERGGKAHALNSAMAQVKTPVVLFCDMRQTAERHSLRLLVSSLMQPGVGAVSGELTHVDPGTQVAANIGLYWRYEKWIRKSESRWRSVVGATGAFYAIKTPCFVPLAPGTLLDDFEIPMQIARQGQRVLLDGRSLVFDELQNDMSGERKRKLRTLGGNFQSFARHPWLFSPRSNPIWLQFLSHKVFRLAVPYAMACALISSLLSSTGWVQCLAAAQVAFYTAAWMGMQSPTWRKSRLIAFATVFVELNWTAMQAGLQFASGRLDLQWEKT
ncbi:glycosyltransferase family 2 protein [Aquabacterium sp.]|jgi:poly-beta-1,6-N-acetyl-D-glucosamine synthase|uniref:glycosyltransferase family 2 protein n=1 Tax=Aquabacterium sp. TaxID=1872578 RepID=UPI0024891269|nr:glycosyltransferase family 2 protein [Aquabacterium sp.]MDI1350428.1 glycosyltransferase family 2 protein [Aquabacterium sp.]